jgi:hypothetical protein
VKTLPEFFQSVDSAVVPLVQKGRSQEASNEEMRFAAVFAKCFAPAQAIRDEARAKARASFFDIHAQEIADLGHSVGALASEFPPPDSADR